MNEELQKQILIFHLKLKDQYFEIKPIAFNDWINSKITNEKIANDPLQRILDAYPEFKESYYKNNELFPKEILNLVYHPYSILGFTESECYERLFKKMDF